MASNHSMSRPPHVCSKKAVTGEPPAAQQTATTTTVQSSNAVKKPPRELKRLPTISDCGGGAGAARADRRRNNGGASATAGTEVAERAAKAWMRRALAKRVATRTLKRSTAPAVDEWCSPKKVIACCCARLPPGLRCALHQGGAPGRSWMRAQRRGGGGGGGECAETVAVAPPKAHRWAYSEYARWRRHVWMPSRFYLERVEHRAASAFVLETPVDWQNFQFSPCRDDQN